MTPRHCSERVAHGTPAPGDAEMFRGQMLLEMAAMSVEDGLVLQLHTGSWRNHNRLAGREVRTGHRG